MKTVEETIERITRAGGEIRDTRHLKNGSIQLLVKTDKDLIDMYLIKNHDEWQILRPVQIGDF